MNNLSARMSDPSLLNILASSNQAVAIYTTDEIVIQFANDTMLSYWGKDSSIIGRPLEEAVPELVGQPFKKMLQKVLETGMVDMGIIPAATMSDSGLRTQYYEYEYRRLNNPEANSYCILHTAINVTAREEDKMLLDQRQIEAQLLTERLAVSNMELLSVNKELIFSNGLLEKSRQDIQEMFLQLEESETALRLAIEAANFGTWHIHSVTRVFITSPRLRELFGFDHDEEITIEQAIGQITEGYREYVSRALENAIYKGGDYDITYPVLGQHDHVLRWLRAIGNLKTHPSGEFSSFTGVVMDVSEMKKDEQRKNDFIGMVSHELKTPLTSLNGYVQVLQLLVEKGSGSFEVMALQNARKQIIRMTSLINGFLNVSRLESGKIYIDKQLFDLSELIQEVEHETVSINTSHKITFASFGPTILVADRDKIGQVINNLISNAIKYSPLGSMIEITCSTGEGHALVSVRDQGIGIGQQDIERLFERFYRVENNQTRSISGFGIGLYLCSEIVERHHGKIWVESKIGNGATFFFTLPLADD